ncbi:DUF935 family protein [Psychroflexus sp. ALD_RP9]|uniref:phage portal protein family protein n=1 Tax=Psychroflexus sp. ALD_RP9 TaxID=2777186 RepID=UPI001A8CBC60|nr:DUF935 family protein [Psychroflexus sp. ALD_RP9]QSS96596.1 DUF935 family protein [Psychroflexus sp. ALD_RP9]
MNAYKQHKNGLYLPKAKTSTRKKVNPKVVEIVEGFKDRSRKDISKWRKAIQFTQLTDKPRFQDYHDLVDDLMTDGHLQSQIMMRLSATLNTDFHVINRKSGEENEELTFLFRQKWFFEFLETALMQIIRGFQLVEFTSFEGFKVGLNTIPQRHIIPTKSKIVPDLSVTDQYINFDDPNFDAWLLKMGKRNNLGLINNIIPALIWKRNVEQSWAEFCERFGIPLITATTPARDNKTIDEVHDMLVGVGEASVGTFPQGTDIKLHEANRTDAFRVYKEFIQLNTDEISKVLVGSTMLSDQGSNRSQTEVHERSLNEKIAASDKRSVMFMVNDQLLPLLRWHGYNISDDDVFEFKTAEQEVELSKLWEITNGLLAQGFNVEQNWISQTFNIPIEGERVVKTPAQNPEKKKNKPSNLAQNFTDKYPVSCCPEHLPTAAWSNSTSKKLKQLTEQLALGMLSQSDVKGIIGQLIVTEALALNKGLYNGFGLADSYTGQDNLVLQMMEYNIFDFAASKTEARSYAVAQRLIDYENGQLKNRSEFLQQCLQDNEMLNTNYLKTEYDTAIATGQNSAAYVRQIKDAKENGNKWVQYQTIGDDAVRSSHRALDGKVFNILEPGNKNIYPPNGYNCRCELVPYTGQVNNVNQMTWDKAEGVLANSDKNYVKSGFNINRGDLKQVFTQKQFYRDIKGLPDKINDMSFDQYGLKSFSELKGKYPKLSLDDSITANNVKELFKGLKENDKLMGFDDYMGRKMTISKKAFDKHTKGKYVNSNERRHQLFPLLKTILKKPDEVWYNSTVANKYQSRYIKFFKDEYIVVDCYLDEKQGLKIKTWYQNKIDEKQLRKGLKVK